MATGGHCITMLTASHVPFALQFLWWKMPWNTSTGNFCRISSTEMWYSQTGILLKNSLLLPKRLTSDWQFWHTDHLLYPTCTCAQQGNYSGQKCVQVGDRNQPGVTNHWNTHHWTGLLHTGVRRGNTAGSTRAKSNDLYLSIPVTPCIYPCCENTFICPCMSYKYINFH